ncbi:hypothetical protein SK128_005724 [Halocaridina rubra]|uniref:Uncharacterized protein n=1 Tax=Halocaridina rubra TaxID=373956 RepID=A0AAN9AAV7_HALRR
MKISLLVSVYKNTLLICMNPAKVDISENLAENFDSEKEEHYFLQPSYEETMLRSSKIDDDNGKEYIQRQTEESHCDEKKTGADFILDPEATVSDLSQVLAVDEEIHGTDMSEKGGESRDSDIHSLPLLPKEHSFRRGNSLDIALPSISTVGEARNYTHSDINEDLDDMIPALSAQEVVDLDLKRSNPSYRNEHHEDIEQNVRGNNDEMKIDTECQLNHGKNFKNKVQKSIKSLKKCSLTEVSENENNLGKDTQISNKDSKYSLKEVSRNENKLVKNTQIATKDRENSSTEVSGNENNLVKNIQITTKDSENSLTEVSGDEKHHVKNTRITASDNTTVSDDVVIVQAENEAKIINQSPNEVACGISLSRPEMESRELHKREESNDTSDHKMEGSIDDQRNLDGAVTQLDIILSGYDNTRENQKHGGGDMKVNLDKETSQVTGILNIKNEIESSETEEDNQKRFQNKEGNSIAIKDVIEDKENSEFFFQLKENDDDASRKNANEEEIKENRRHCQLKKNDRASSMISDNNADSSQLRSVIANAFKDKEKESVSHSSNVEPSEKWHKRLQLIKNERNINDSNVCVSKEFPISETDEETPQKPAILNANRNPSSDSILCTSNQSSEAHTSADELVHVNSKEKFGSKGNINPSSDSVLCASNKSSEVHTSADELVHVHSKENSESKGSKNQSVISKGECSEVLEKLKSDKTGIGENENSFDSSGNDDAENGYVSLHRPEDVEFTRKPQEHGKKEESPISKLLPKSQDNDAAKSIDSTTVSKLEEIQERKIENKYHDKGPGELTRSNDNTEDINSESSEDSALTKEVCSTGIGSRFQAKSESIINRRETEFQGSPSLTDIMKVDIGITKREGEKESNANNPSSSWKMLAPHVRKKDDEEPLSLSNTSEVQVSDINEITGELFKINEDKNPLEENGNREYMVNIEANNDGTSPSKMDTVNAFAADSENTEIKLPGVDGTETTDKRPIKYMSDKSEKELPKQTVSEVIETPNESQDGIARVSDGQADTDRGTQDLLVCQTDSIMKPPSFKEQKHNTVDQVVIIKNVNDMSSVFKEGISQLSVKENFVSATEPPSVNEVTSDVDTIKKLEDASAPQENRIVEISHENENVVLDPQREISFKKSLEIKDNTEILHSSVVSDVTTKKINELKETHAEDINATDENSIERLIHNNGDISDNMALMKASENFKDMKISPTDTSEISQFGENSRKKLEVHDEHIASLDKSDDEVLLNRKYVDDTLQIKSQYNVEKVEEQSDHIIEDTLVSTSYIGDEKSDKHMKKHFQSKGIVTYTWEETESVGNLTFSSEVSDGKLNDSKVRGNEIMNGKSDTVADDNQNDKNAFQNEKMAEQIAPSPSEILKDSNVKFQISHPRVRASKFGSYSKEIIDDKRREKKPETYGTYLEEGLPTETKASQRNSKDNVTERKSSIDDQKGFKNFKDLETRNSAHVKNTESIQSSDEGQAEYLKETQELLGNAEGNIFDKLESNTERDDKLVNHMDTLQDEAEKKLSGKYLTNTQESIDMLINPEVKFNGYDGSESYAKNSENNSSFQDCKIKPGTALEAPDVSKNTSNEKQSMLQDYKSTDLRDIAHKYKLENSQINALQNIVMLRKELISSEHQSSQSRRNDQAESQQAQMSFEGDENIKNPIRDEKYQNESESDQNIRDNSTKDKVLNKHSLRNGDDNYSSQADHQIDNIEMTSEVKEQRNEIKREQSFDNNNLKKRGTDMKVKVASQFNRALAVASEDSKVEENYAKDSMYSAKKLPQGNDEALDVQVPTDKNKSMVPQNENYKEKYQIIQDIPAEIYFDSGHFTNDATWTEQDKPVYSMKESVADEIKQATGRGFEECPNAESTDDNKREIENGESPSYIVHLDSDEIGSEKDKPVYGSLENNVAIENKQNARKGFEECPNTGSRDGNAREVKNRENPLHNEECPNTESRDSNAREVKNGENPLHNEECPNTESRDGNAREVKNRENPLHNEECPNTESRDGNAREVKNGENPLHNEECPNTESRDGSAREVKNGENPLHNEECPNTESRDGSAREVKNGENPLHNEECPNTESRDGNAREVKNRENPLHNEECPNTESRDGNAREVKNRENPLHNADAFKDSISSEKRQLHIETDGPALPNIGKLNGDITKKNDKDMGVSDLKNECTCNTSQSCTCSVNEKR